MLGQCPRLLALKQPKEVDVVGVKAPTGAATGALVPSRGRDSATALIEGDSGTFVLCSQMSLPVRVVEASLVNQPELTLAITRIRILFVIGVLQRI